MLKILVPASLLASSVAFGLGISLPLVQFEKLYFFSETPSLVQMVYGLWSDGDLAIAVLVATFSIAFPMLKMLIVFHTATSRAKGNFPGWLAALSKWSMMDVLLVALVIFGAKTSGLATAIAQPGLWFYAAAALLSVGSAHMIKYLHGSNTSGGHETTATGERPVSGD